MGFGVGLEGDFHVLAGADAGYAVEAKLEESAADGLALGIADGGAKLDIDFGEVHCAPSVDMDGEDGVIRKGLLRAEFSLPSQPSPIEGEGALVQVYWDVLASMKARMAASSNASSV